MTSDGVDGTGGEDRSRVGLPVRACRSCLIKPDDGLLAARYTERAYPHTRAGSPCDSHRHERQVAPALRDCTDFTIASLTSGTGGETAPAEGVACPKGSR